MGFGHAWCSGCYSGGTGIPLHFVFWVSPLDLRDSLRNISIRKIGTSRSKLAIPTYHSIAIYKFYYLLSNHLLPMSSCNCFFRDSQALSAYQTRMRRILLQSLSKFPTAAISKSRDPCMPATHGQSETQVTLSNTSDQSRTHAFASATPEFHMLSHTLFCLGCHVPRLPGGAVAL